MNQALTISLLIAGAVLAALTAALGMAGTVHLTSRRSSGYMHFIFYAMVLVVALSGLLSGRDFTGAGLNLAESGVPARHPLLVWVQPLISLLLLTVAGERVIAYWIRRDKSVHAPPLLLTTFMVFWAGTVAAPALFGAHPYLSHDYAYPLVIGVAAVLTDGTGRDLAFRATRNALFLFIVASLLLLPLNTDLVLEHSYAQGLLPGVPRFAGLASHPVSLGLLTQLALLCLMAFPFSRVWLNRLAWATGLGVLFMAQSKAAWIAFILCSACLLVVRRGPAWWRRVGDPVRPEFGMMFVLMFMAAVATVAGVVLFGDVSARWSSFLDSDRGAQLTSLTGRDQIWAIAYAEWQRNPLFGYGPTLWDASFRASIGMPSATHAHNQFMDTLSRAGSVGASVLTLYALVLLVLSLRYARASGGLSLALFVALALRSVSEVPLNLMGYGAELIAQVLLLMTLAAAGSDARVRQAQSAGASHAGSFKTGRDPLATARFTP